jgi:hypothetical protein
MYINVIRVRVLVFVNNTDFDGYEQQIGLSPCYSASVSDIHVNNLQCFIFLQWRGKLALNLM